MAPSNRDLVESSDRTLRRKKTVNYFPRKNIKSRGPSHWRQPKERGFRKLTNKRLKKIAAFLQSNSIKPGIRLGAFGSRAWARELIKFLKEPENGPTEDDVKNWLYMTRGFEEVKQTIRKIIKQINSKLPPGLSAISCNPYDQEESDSDDSDSSDSKYIDSDDTDSSDSGDDFSPKNFEPVNGKVGWCATTISEDSDTDGNNGSEDNSMSSDTGCSLMDIKASENHSELEQRTKLPTSFSMDRQKVTLKIFPDGFKWKNIGVKPESPEEKEVKSSTVSEMDNSEEEGGTFVACMSLTTENNAGEPVTSNSNEADEDGRDEDVFSSNEKGTATAMIKNKSCNEQEMDVPTANDVSALQYHANKMMAIARRNSTGENSTGINWGAVCGISSLLSMMVQRKS